MACQASTFNQNLSDRQTTFATFDKVNVSTKVELVGLHYCSGLTNSPAKAKIVQFYSTWKVIKHTISKITILQSNGYAYLIISKAPAKKIKKDKKGKGEYSTLLLILVFFSCS